MQAVHIRFGAGLSIRETNSDHPMSDGQYKKRKLVLFSIPPNVAMNAIMMAFKIKVAEDLAVFPNDRDLSVSRITAAEPPRR
jgi:hypothetical protein